MSRVRLLILLLFAVLVVGFGAASPALADDGGGHGGGEPENINIFERAIDLGIWSIVVFVLLLIVLRIMAWKPMIEGLQKREERIHGAIEEARRDREEAQRLRQQLQQEMDKAQEKVRDIIEEGRRAAQRNNDEMLAKARAEIQAERDRQRREIEMARDQALQQLWSQTAQLATLVSAKAVRRQLSEDDHRRLIDEAVAELRQAGEQWQAESASVQA